MIHWTLLTLFCSKDKKSSGKILSHNYGITEHRFMSEITPKSPCDAGHEIGNSIRDSWSGREESCHCLSERRPIHLIKTDISAHIKQFISKMDLFLIRCGVIIWSTIPRNWSVSLSNNFCRFFSRCSSAFVCSFPAKTLRWDNGKNCSGKLTPVHKASGRANGRS